jgi:RNA polymerase sigma factor, sigma-70 family
MDTSIRLYNTNSGLGSSTNDEQGSHSTIPQLETEESREGTARPKNEDANNVDPSEEARRATRTTAQQERVDVADFEAIFTRFQMPITNFIYHLIGNREQAYDLAQDVFVKAYKALLGGTVVQPGALSAWLYRIAANTTTDSLRRRRLISWLPLSLFNEDRGIGAGVVSDSGGNSTENFNGSGDEQNNEPRSSNVTALYGRNNYDGGRFESQVANREIIDRVLQQMPQKYSVCLWLYENDGLSCAEIAEVLNISPSAVKMRLMRARERFIGLYKKEVSEE